MNDTDNSNSMLNEMEFNMGEGDGEESKMSSVLSQRMIAEDMDQQQFLTAGQREDQVHQVLETDARLRHHLVVDLECLAQHLAAGNAGERLAIDRRPRKYSQQAADAGEK